MASIERALFVHRPRRLPFVTGFRKAAVAAVLREAPNLELLFIRRAQHPEDPWSGHMAFPGGRVDDEDPHPRAAAVRETREELSLDLDRQGAFLGALSPLPAMAHGKPLPLVVLPFVFRLQESRDLTPNEEVDEAVWVPLDFLLNSSNRSTLPKVVAGRTIDLPCFDYRTRVIWGLTLRMVDELLDVIRPR